MGKGWDNFGTDLQKYQEWTRRWAIEALRIAKPGATLLCFGSPKTYHRLTCAIEDAGWIIKDCIMWVYGSGFPKATDISKQIDNCEWRKYKGQSKEAKLWNGWKSHGLKPAWEPIIMAMKPNEGSYAENALKWGVAGLNIDGGRIGIKGGVKKVNIKQNSGGFAGKGFGCNGELEQLNKGRFPANLIHDGSDEVVACFPNSKSTGGTGKIGLDSDVNLGGGNNYYNFGDSGNASRFFKSILYYPKASKSERNKGCEGPVKNNHPTVKPLKLMEYLCVLTKTPTGGIVLDPFVGSGTTCVAAKMLDRHYIGIELNEEYIKIAQNRLDNISQLEF